MMNGNVPLDLELTLGCGVWAPSARTVPCSVVAHAIYAKHFRINTLDDPSAIQRYATSLPLPAFRPPGKPQPGRHGRIDEGPDDDCGTPHRDPRRCRRRSSNSSAPISPLAKRLSRICRVSPSGRRMSSVPNHATELAHGLPSLHRRTLLDSLASPAVG